MEESPKLEQGLLELSKKVGLRAMV